MPGRSSVFDPPLLGRSIYCAGGACANDRDSEHSCCLGSSPSGTLAVHCHRCGCQPAFTRFSILARSRARVTTELIEAHYIFAAGDTCASIPSVALSWKTNVLSFDVLSLTFLSTTHWSGHDVCLLSLSVFCAWRISSSAVRGLCFSLNHFYC